MTSKQSSYAQKAVSTLLDWASGGCHPPRLLCHQRSWLLCPQKIPKSSIKKYKMTFWWWLLCPQRIGAGPARPRPGQAWLRPSVAATQPLCGFHTDHAVRHGRPGRRGRPGRHARKSEATGVYAPRPPRTHTQDRYPALRGGGE